jgi:putative phosphoribosyl transferase
MFDDRRQAGRLLAAALKKYKGEPGVILAIPRGGVPVGYEVARELKYPMEVVLTKKIGHPNNKEYAIGAASLTDYFIIPEERVSESYIINELQLVRRRLREMNEIFRGNHNSASLKDKTAIIIDDGIATGNTILGTVLLTRNRDPAKIVIGAPVAARTSVKIMQQEVDEIIVLSTPLNFYGVGQFYTNFNEVSDEEVISLLNGVSSFQTD